MRCGHRAQVHWDSPWGAEQEGSLEQNRCACADRVGSERHLKAGPGVLYHLKTLQIGEDALLGKGEGSKSQGEGVAVVGRPAPPACVALIEVMEEGGGRGQGG